MDCFSPIGPLHQYRKVAIMFVLATGPCSDTTFCHVHWNSQMRVVVVIASMHKYTRCCQCCPNVISWVGHTQSGIMQSERYEPQQQAQTGLQCIHICIIAVLSPFQIDLPALRASCLHALAGNHLHLTKVCIPSIFLLGLCTRSSTPVCHT